MVAGMRSSRIASLTRSAASPSEKPGLQIERDRDRRKLPEMIHAERADAARSTFTTASSGTSGPCEDRTYNFESASGVR